MIYLGSWTAPNFYEAHSTAVSKRGIIRSRSVPCLNPSHIRESLFGLMSAVKVRPCKVQIRTFANAPTLAFPYHSTTQIHAGQPLQISILNMHSTLRFQRCTGCSQGHQRQLGEIASQYDFDGRLEARSLLNVSQPSKPLALIYHDHFHHLTSAQSSVSSMPQGHRHIGVEMGLIHR